MQKQAIKGIIKNDFFYQNNNIYITCIFTYELIYHYKNIYKLYLE